MNTSSLLIAAAAVSIATAAAAQNPAGPSASPQAPGGPSAAAGPPTRVEAPPAPAVKAGDLVIDRTGAQVGSVKTLTESEVGALVVVEIEGKLIGLKSSTLRVEGARVTSSQTRAEMLAAAAAPG